MSQKKLAQETKSEKKKALRFAEELQEDSQHQIAENARDIPWDRPRDAKISGYKTTQEERDDLAQNIGPLNRENQGLNQENQVKLNRAEKSRITALTPLQRLGDATTLLPDDFRFYLHQQIVNEDGIIPGVGKALLTDSHPFWEYAAKKEALKVQEDYMQFKLSQIDLSTPESRQFWETRHPELTKKLRLGLRKQRMERAKLEDIGSFGVQNEKDLWLLYKKERGIDNGILGLGISQQGNVAGALEKPLGTTGTTTRGQNTWGIFSIPPGNGPTITSATSIQDTNSANGNSNVGFTNIFGKIGEYWSQQV